MLAKWERQALCCMIDDPVVEVLCTLKNAQKKSMTVLTKP